MIFLSVTLTTTVSYIIHHACDISCRAKYRVAQADFISTTAWWCLYLTAPLRQLVSHWWQISFLFMKVHASPTKTSGNPAPLPPKLVEIMSLFHQNWRSQASKIVRNRMRTNALHFAKKSLMYRPFSLNTCSFNGIMRLKHMSWGVCMQMLFRKSTLQNISHDIGDIAVRLANAGSDRL